jgi:hypothetical protein
LLYRDGISNLDGNLRPQVGGAGIVVEVGKFVGVIKSVAVGIGYVVGDSVAEGVDGVAVVVGGHVVEADVDRFSVPLQSGGSREAVLTASRWTVLAGIGLGLFLFWAGFHLKNKEALRVPPMGNYEPKDWVWTQSVATHTAKSAGWNTLGEEGFLFMARREEGVYRGISDR